MIENGQIKRLLITTTWRALFASYRLVVQPPIPTPQPTMAMIAAIRALYDRWAKVFEAYDIEGIMANDAPGDAVVAYDVVAPLRRRGQRATPSRPHKSCHCCQPLWFFGLLVAPNHQSRASGVL